MNVRFALKAATQADHDRVDALFSRLDLADVGDYGRFLTAQAAAHIPVEAAIDAAGAERLVPDWPERRRSGALRADLDALGLAIPEPVAPPAIISDAQLLGAIYVVEGSRLGGSILKRQLLPGVPSRFLDANQAPGNWRKLLEMLDEHLYDPALIEVAAGGAQRVFGCFERAGQIYLESHST